MGRQKAKEIINLKLKEIESTSYEDLKKYIGKPYIKKFEIQLDGRDYWGDIQAFWDDKDSENIRVLGCISYSFFTSFIPVCDDYIITPENKFL